MLVVSSAASDGSSDGAMSRSAEAVRLTKLAKLGGRISASRGFANLGRGHFGRWFFNRGLFSRWFFGRWFAQ